MNFVNSLLLTQFIVFTFSILPSPGHSAISLDRTRIIFNAEEKSVSINVGNSNKQLPYLAQTWLEDDTGKKISSPLTALPPIQRLEPSEKSQIKIQALPDVKKLPQDRESLFYFNLREIPPKSGKANTLQLALQSKIKLFYRPKAIAVRKGDKPWQENLVLTKVNNSYKINNPTPYFVTLVQGRKNVSADPSKKFKPVMLPPKQDFTIIDGNEILGHSPVLTYINDYGGRVMLQFSCSSTECQVKKTE